MLVSTLEIDFATNMSRLVQDVQTATRAVVSGATQMQEAADLAKKALGLLGVGLSVGAFAHYIQGAVELADQLNKLSQRTGVATEALSQLRFAAKLSDVSADDLTTGLKKLNLSIAEGLGGSQAKVEVFRNLGVSLKDASGQAKTADKAMLDIADAFSHAQDGATKTAYAVALFRKAGDQMIPMLNGGSEGIKEMMAKADKLGLTISSEFARHAEEFNDNLTMLKASGDKLAITMGSALVESLGKAAKAMADASVEGGKLKGLAAGLNVIGDEFFNWSGHQQLKGITNLRDQIKSLSAQLSAPVLDLFGQMDGMRAQLDQKTQQLDKALAAYFNLTSAAGAGRGALKDPRALGDPGSIAQQTAAMLKPLSGGGSATESDFDKLTKKIREQSDAWGQQLAIGRQLNEFEKLEVKTMADMKTAKVAFTEAQKASVAADLAAAKVKFDGNKEREAELHNASEEAKFWAKTEAELAAADRDRTDERDKVNRSIADQTQALADSNEQLKLEASLIGATDREKAIAMGNLQIEINKKAEILKLNLDLKLTEKDRIKAMADVEANAQAAKAQLEERANLQEQMTLMGKLQDTGKQVWDTLWQGGSDTFKNLGKVLKTSLIDVLYELVAKRWIFNIVGNVTGGVTGGIASAGGSAAGSSIFGSAAGSAGGSMFSGIGSAIAGGYSGAGAAGFAATGGSFASTVGGGLATDAMGATVAEGAAAATVETGAMGAASAGLAAIPVVGWIALAAVALYSMFGNKGGGPKNIGAFSSDSSLYDNSRSDSNGAANAAAQTSVQGILGAYGAAAASLGVTAGKLNASVLTSIDDKGNGDAQTALAVQAWLNGKLVYDRNNALSGSDAYKDVGRTPEELQAAMTLAASRAVLAALQATDLPAQLGDYFKTLDPLAMSADEIAQALAVAQAAQQVWTVFGQLGPAFQHFSDMTVDATASFLQLAGGLDAFKAQSASYAANFLTDDERRRITAQSISTALGGAGVNFSTDQILGATREQFRAVVEQFAAMGTAGEAQVAALFKVNEAFASIVPATQAASQAVTDLGRSFGFASTYDAALARQNSNIAAHAAFAQQTAGIGALSADSAISRAQQAVIDAQDAAVKAQQNVNTALNTTVNQLNALATSLRAMRDGLDGSDLGGLSGSVRYDAAKRALSGATAETAPELVKQFLDAAKDNARTSTDYSREVALAKTVLESVEAATRGQAQQVAAQAAAETQAAQTTANLAVLAANAKLQMTQLNQVMSAVSSGARPDIDMGGLNAQWDAMVTDLYQKSGMNKADFEAWASQALNTAVTLPSFAGGGAHGGGWAVVGENGPELANLGPSHIYSNSQSVGMMDDVVAAIERLDARLSSIDDHTGRTDRTLRSVVNGNETFTTEVAAV